MAETLSVRLTASERRALDGAAAAHLLGPSSYAKVLIRKGLGLAEEALSGGPDEFERLEGFERRLSRLEEMAGL